VKKICWFLTVLLMLGSFSVTYAEEAAVTVTYRSGLSNTQGQDNFYICEFNGNEAVELPWDASVSRWKGTEAQPMVKYDFMNPSTAKDVGFKFVAPTIGMVRLKGEATIPYADVKNGNGMILSIYKGSKQIWKAGPIEAGSAAYDLTISVKTGDELYFKANANGNQDWDWVYWWPTVDYLAMDFVNDDTCKYFQKDKDGNMKELEFSSETYGYTADDDLAFISTSEVFPTEKYSLVKRYEVTQRGRQRVYASLEDNDNRGGGNVAYIYKNGEKVWEQLFVPGKEQVLDVRLLAELGDIIDVEIAVNDYTGYNYTKWDCNIAPYFGISPVCEASTSEGRENGKIKEFTLGSMVGSTQGGNGVRYYSTKFNVEYPMTYDSGAKRWKSTVKNDGGYISSTEMNAASDWATSGDTVMEITLSDSGILHIDGMLDISTAGDGALVEMYHNNKLLWSNRVGGKVNARWDDPFDTHYFLNRVNAVANVVRGDKLKITVNRWRKYKNDNVGIGDIKLSYITGDILSDTTKWKIDNSIVIDTAEKTAYQNGEKTGIDLVINNGTTYVELSDAQKLFDNIQITDEKANFGGKEYVAIRSFAESNGKYVSWAANRMILIHDSFEVFFGYPELSEIETVIKTGGDLFE